MESVINVFLAITFLIVILIYASMWVIFDKAGKPGWAALIPIYNTIVFFEIIKKPWWWLFLWMIPYIGIIWIIWSYNLLAKKFGKSEAFTLGIIFLSFIFIPILAFGSAKYTDLKDSTASALAEQDAGSKTSDALIFIVIMFMLFNALAMFLLNIIFPRWFESGARYIYFTINIIWAAGPVLLCMAIRNKTLKIFGIIFGALYSIYIITSNIVSLIGFLKIY